MSASNWSPSFGESLKLRPVLGVAPMRQHKPPVVCARQLEHLQLVQAGQAEAINGGQEEPYDEQFS
jgi:hypothetical protein